MKLGDGWLKGAEPKSGVLRTKITIVVYSVDDCESGYEGEVAGEAWERVSTSNGLAELRRVFGANMVDLREDTEEEWL